MKGLSSDLLDVLVAKFPRKTLGTFATLSTECRNIAREKKYSRSVTQMIATRQQEESFATWLIAGHADTVRYLSLTYAEGCSPVSLRLALALGARGLESLHIHVVPGAPPIDLGPITRGLPKLETLGVFGTRLVTSLDLRNLTSLKALILHGGIENDSENDSEKRPLHLSGITDIPNLEILEIRNIDDNICTCRIENMTTLKELCLTGHDDMSFTEDGEDLWYPVQDIDFLSALTGLSVLSLGSSSGCGDTLNYNALSGLTNLTSLSFDAKTTPFRAGCFDDRRNSDDLMMIVRDSLKIEYLSCTDAAFPELTSSTITHLCVSPDSLIETLAGGIWSLSRLPNLEQLTIFDMHDLQYLDLDFIVIEFSKPRATPLTLELACLAEDVRDHTTLTWMNALMKCDPVGNVHVEYTVAHK